MDGERMGEKHQRVVASHTPHTGDLACNPGMCHDWELKCWPFGSQAGVQSTEPHKPGQTFGFLIMMCLGVGLLMNPLLKTVWQLLKIKHRVFILPTNFTPTYTPNKIENMYTKTPT